MAINNNFLLRGRLSETDKHLATSSSSPDIIGHKQVEDPVSYFRNNYNTDPSESVDIKRNFSTIYVRAKNTANDGTVNQGYLHLYQCGYSLFMKPSLWSRYRMKTIRGYEYVTLSSDRKGEIAVGTDCFQIDTTSGFAYCLAAVISDTPEAHIPNDFKNSDEYVHWVCTNNGVCFRNLRTVSSGTRPSYEQKMRIEGSGTTQLGFFRMVCENVPAGTTIRMECSALGMDVSKVIDDKMLIYSCDIPGSLDTFLIMSAKTPNGNWPANASLKVEYYTAVTDTGLSYGFGVAPEELGLHENQMFMKAFQDEAGPTGHLILTGSCGTVFV